MQSAVIFSADRDDLLLEPRLRLQILEQKQIPAPATTHEGRAADAIGSLHELLESIAVATGLEVSIYPPPRRGAASKLDALPINYRRHMSDFCLAAKRTRDGRGCRGHDATQTNARAAAVGHSFVQTCHRGVAEVIVPIFSGREHLATLFIGQAVTPRIESKGFDAIWHEARHQVMSRSELADGFAKLARRSETELHHIGLLVDAAVRGLAERLSAEAFALEVRLQGAPAIRRAIDILHRERCLGTTASQMADRVQLSPSHFSRLFHRVVGQTFSRYVLTQRIRAAQVLLHHSDMTVADIARRCGFTRQSYFTLKFREVCQMTPSAFRRNPSPQASGPHGGWPRHPY